MDTIFERVHENSGRFIVASFEFRGHDKSAETAIIVIVQNRYHHRSRWKSSARTRDIAIVQPSPKEDLHKKPDTCICAKWACSGRLRADEQARPRGI